jgi:cell division protein FtsB
MVKIQMSEIRTTKIDGQEFVTLTDYLRLKEEKQELEYLWDINEELKEENRKLKEQIDKLLNNKQ